VKKRYIIPVVGAIASAGVGYLLMKKDKTNGKTTMMDTLANAGIPDQISNENQEPDQLENAKMVSEGSQFGVQYFNKATVDKIEDLEKEIEK